MRNLFLLLVTISIIHYSPAQQVMTPETLWSLGRITAETTMADRSVLLYSVKNYDLTTGKAATTYWTIPFKGVQTAQPTLLGINGISNIVSTPSGNRMAYLSNGQVWIGDWDGTNSKQISRAFAPVTNFRFSPNGQYILLTMDIKTHSTATDIYPDLTGTTAKIIDNLAYRHWDTWEDGYSSHVFYAKFDGYTVSEPIDIMTKEPFDSPQMPFGGLEDVIWSSDSKDIIYVCKKYDGTKYALSTNTDIYSYDITSHATFNLTKDNKGYDTNPTISPSGRWFSWLSMETEGYEADKNRLMIEDIQTGKKYDITKGWDETVESFAWDLSSRAIYFIAPTNGTLQLFEATINDSPEKNTPENIRQVTQGDWDISSIVTQPDNEKLIVTRTDMNHAAEIYSVEIKNGTLNQITYINKQIYDKITLSKTERKIVKTTDGKDMLVWMIYPPNFDANKKYPTLLYCQGGPQSALTQFYSFRWNFQLMAAQGYIVVAPNRRGMPGHGTEWNAEISKDWGGQPIRDYLSAIDYAKTLPYVDADRCGAVGASYGGYSVYMLAGVHEGRFKTFIAHDGLFNLESFYGTTDEMWFANWDMGGSYWEKGDQSKSYDQFNPINFVQKWDTPILIYQGGKDYRTTEDQAFQAFQAAQLMGIKSRFVYLPDENHWVTGCHDALLWQREFYKWLKETL